MNDCIFCRIASGEIPSRVAYDGDELFAFHDVSPQAPVHVLIVPKRHIANIAETTDSDSALIGRMLRTAAKVADQLGVAQSGYRTVFNVGADGGQSVDHLHLHLLGGRAMAWPPG